MTPRYFEMGGTSSAPGWIPDAADFHPGVDNRPLTSAQTKGVILGGRSAGFLNFGGIAILVLVQADIVRQHPDKLLPVALVTLIGVGAWLSWLVPPGLGRGVHLWQVSALGVSAIGMVLTTSDAAAIIPAVVATAASTRLEQRISLAFVATFIIAFLAAAAVTLRFQPISLISYGLGLAFAYLAARSTTDLRNEQARTKTLLTELQKNREVQLQAAAINERARIAREIHDVLAHTLAALSVQLEGARVGLQQRGSDPEALAAVERAHHLAREGLNETRRAVSALRGDEIPGTDRLARLVAEFRADTGIATEFSIAGMPRQLQAEAQLALFRTAQEALTNVRKHATPRRVDVHLRYEPKETELIVADHGDNGTEPSAEGGYGLVGMRERAELLGGSLDAHPTDDGFIVVLRIPG